MNNEFQSIETPFYIRYIQEICTLIERFALRLKIMPIKCTVCGSFQLVEIKSDNFRENCICKNCNSFNRQRQIAFVLCKAIAKKNIKSILDLSSTNQFSIYNTETGGVLHKYLSKIEDYVCSEYFGPNYKSGEFVNDRIHQDLMSLSFPENRFDFIISTDVFEHIPDPYLAHAEIWRV